MEAGGLRTAVEVTGSGPPVVLLHGGIANRSIWRPQVAALRHEYTVVTYDLRGHGETRTIEDCPAAGPAGTTRIEAYPPRLYAEDLEALAQSLGLESFSLVGLSLGGLIAQEYALAHPERVRALVIADSWVVTVASRRGRALGRAITPVVAGALAVIGTRPLGRLARAGINGGRGDEAALSGEATAASDRHEAVRVFRGLAFHDTRDRLPLITAPTLVIVGERDRSRPQSQLMARLIEGAELVQLDGAGHNTNLQRPEEFSAAVRAFLERVHRPARPPALPPGEDGN